MCKSSPHLLAIPAAIMLILSSAPATVQAGIGTGIGISFPASHTSSAMPDTYAALRYGKLVEELTVQERHGKLLLELKVTNSGDEAYTIEHHDGQVYDFSILDKNGQELYRWSHGMAFTQAFSTSCLAAHSSEVYKAELDRKAYQQIKNDAVLVTAWLKDTPCTLSAKVPTRTAARSTPVIIHGGIILGNGHWDDD